MTKKPRNDDPDEDFSVTLPEEHRQESRVPQGHTYSQWKFKLHWYNYRCAYCGIRDTETPEGYLTRDHIIPIIEGGDDDIDNIVPACWSCNEGKGKKLPSDFKYPKVRQRRSPNG